MRASRSMGIWPQRGGGRWSGDAPRAALAQRAKAAHVLLEPAGNGSRAIGDGSSRYDLGPKGGTMSGRSSVSGDLMFDTQPRTPAAALVSARALDVKGGVRT